LVEAGGGKTSGEVSITWRRLEYREYWGVSKQKDQFRVTSNRSQESPEGKRELGCQKNVERVRLVVGTTLVKAEGKARANDELRLLERKSI